MMYAKNAKFTTAQSQPTLTFMENCVVEICGLDPYTTYTHMFVYVRQLAIHLRGAMTTRKKVGGEHVTWHHTQRRHTSMLVGCSCSRPSQHRLQLPQ